MCDHYRGGSVEGNTFDIQTHTQDRHAISSGQCHGMDIRQIQFGQEQ